MYLVLYIIRERVYTLGVTYATEEGACNAARDAADKNKDITFKVAKVTDKSYTVKKEEKKYARVFD